MGAAVRDDDDDDDDDDDNDDDDNNGADNNYGGIYDGDDDAGMMTVVMMMVLMRILSTQFRRKAHVNITRVTLSYGPGVFFGDSGDDLPLSRVRTPSCIGPQSTALSLADTRDGPSGGPQPPFDSYDGYIDIGKVRVVPRMAWIWTSPKIEVFGRCHEFHVIIREDDNGGRGVHLLGLESLSLEDTQALVYQCNVSGYIRVRDMTTTVLRSNEDKVPTGLNRII
eukprot:CAMPEP_0184482230 /NCGR_PEP_ID=MMETSP0113_2-20130426/3802_1 /TAXON_ID=91329 /ORGANISM="Norrisiella sphaerica, Strain BC52" /LENGTH=223 /DNA_ID=CAMNT_0026861841 /DNA_START=289 /DNA_END=962 /DNA_ORIENTATION=-